MKRGELGAGEHEVNQRARASGALIPLRNPRMRGVEIGSVHLAKMAAFGMRYEGESRDDASYGFIHAGLDCSRHGLYSLAMRIIRISLVALVLCGAVFVLLLAASIHTYNMLTDETLI